MITKWSIGMLAIQYTKRNNMSLKSIGKSAHDVNVGNGWDTFTPESFPKKGQKSKIRFVCTHMALVHTEVSEATEAIRHLDKSNFTEELADVVIRVASIAHGLGLDLDKAVKKKIAVNKTRGLHHGGKAV